MAKYVDQNGLDRFYDNIADRPVQAFDTVAAMQAATYLEAGMTCHVNGNATVGDGGAAYYKVAASGDIALQGGLYAKAIADCKNEYIKAVVEHQYLGRIYLDNSFEGVNPQSMCMYSDAIAFAAISNSDTTNKCSLVKVNLLTGEVLSNTSTDFAHCNGMAYNSANNKLYVCPTNDYVSGTTVNAMYVCDPDTLEIVETLSFDFVPHSICYDKVTAQMWLAALGNATELYSFDYGTKSAAYVCDIPDYSAISSHIGFSGFSVGRQQIGAFGGELYFLFGGEFNAIVNFDTSGTIKNTIGMSEQLYIYTLVEAEGMDFTSDGSIVLFSKARLPVDQYFATFSYFGTGSLFNMSVVNKNEVINAYLNGSATENQSIFHIGTNTKPFIHFEEAYNAIRLGYFARIRLQGNTSVRLAAAPDKYNSFILRVMLQNYTLTFEQATSLMQDAYFSGGTVAFGSSINTPLKFYAADATFENVTFDCTNATTAIMQIVAGTATFISCSVINSDSSGFSSGNVNLHNDSNIEIKNSPNIVGYNFSSNSTFVYTNNAGVSAQTTTQFDVSKVSTRAPLILMIGRGENMGLWLINSGAIVELKQNQYVTASISSNVLSVTSAYGGELGISVIGYGAVNIKKI